MELFCAPPMRREQEVAILRHCFGSKGRWCRRWLVPLLSLPSERRQRGKLDKLPEYLRDTMDWFMGYVWLKIFHRPIHWFIRSWHRFLIVCLWKCLDAATTYPSCKLPVYRCTHCSRHPISKMNTHELRKEFLCLLVLKTCHYFISTRI